MHPKWTLCRMCLRILTYQHFRNTFLCSCSKPKFLSCWQLFTMCFWKSKTMQSMRSTLQHQQRNLCLWVPKLFIMQTISFILRFMSSSIVFSFTNKRMCPRTIFEKYLQYSELLIMFDWKSMFIMFCRLLIEPKQFKLYFSKL